MTKNTMKEAAVAAGHLLFDDWGDAIEDGVRSRARSFSETMLEEELDPALSRLRYGRRKRHDGGGEPPVVGDPPRLSEAVFVVHVAAAPEES